MTATYADSHDGLVERLDIEVRSLVRREGVDPQRDAGLVRRIAEGVVRDHDELSLTGAVAPVPDGPAMVGELVARVSGFGPLQQFLDDPAVEEIWINDPTRVFVARNGRHELTNLMLTTAQVQELTERMLKSSGRRIDISQPFVDAMLPEGHRLHVVLEGISRGFSAVNIRKFVLKAARLQDLVSLGSMTQQAAQFLDASVRAGLNILVAGGTQAGNPTMGRDTPWTQGQETNCRHSPQSHHAALDWGPSARPRRGVRRFVSCSQPTLRATDHAPCRRTIVFAHVPLAASTRPGPPAPSAQEAR